MPVEAYNVVTRIAEFFESVPCAFSKNNKRDVEVFESSGDLAEVGKGE